MSEERFDRLEKMMEQLIHMVGHNNAVTEELRQRMDRLGSKVDNLEIRIGALESKVDNLEIRIGALESKVDNLEIRMDRLESKADNLEIRVGKLESKMDSGFEGLTRMVNLLGEKIEAVPRIESKLEVLNQRLFEQEAEIKLLKRAM